MSVVLLFLRRTCRSVTRASVQILSWTLMDIPLEWRYDSSLLWTIFYHSLISRILASNLSLQWQQKPFLGWKSGNLTSNLNLVICQLEFKIFGCCSVCAPHPPVLISSKTNPPNYPLPFSFPGYHWPPEHTSIDASKQQSHCSQTDICYCREAKLLPVAACAQLLSSVNSTSEL